MSKASRKKAAKKKKHTRKKQESSCSNEVRDKRRLRFVAYMLEDDACNFSGTLCSMDVDDVIKAKYQNFCFDGVVYIRISLYVYDNYICRAYKVLENSQLVSLGSKYFSSPRCRGLFTHQITEENFCLVGQLTLHTLDQFKSDARESGALYESEILPYKVLNTLDVIIEIYTNNINREFALAVLDDGWMSDRWGKQFQKIIPTNIA